MKIKHTNVRLSLFVLAAALIFGNVASNAQSRDFQLSQIVPHKKIYLDVPDISNTEEVRESDSWKKAVSASIVR